MPRTAAAGSCHRPHRRARPDHGCPARRSCLSHDPGPGRVRHRRRQHLRQPPPVRRPRGHRALPPYAGLGHGGLRRSGCRRGVRALRPRDVPALAHARRHHRLGASASAKGGKGRHDRVISTASPPSSPSSSPSPVPAGPISARRTSSSWPWCARWWPTCRSRSTSWGARSCGSGTVWRSRAATSASRRRSAPAAVVLSRALAEGRALLEQGVEFSSSVAEAMRQVVESEPLVQAGLCGGSGSAGPGGARSDRGPGGRAIAHRGRSGPGPAHRQLCRGRGPPPRRRRCCARPARERAGTPSGTDRLTGATPHDEVEDP